MVLIRILSNQFSGMRSLFFQTSSISIQTPYRAVMGENKIFPFVLQSSSTVNLPLNLPKMVSENYNYPLSILSYTSANASAPIFQTNLTQSSSYTYYVNQDRYWKNMQQLTIPYIPYFSNCQYYGQFIYLHQIIEDSELCKLYTPQNTKPIDQIGFQQIPTSDTCDQVQFQCIMDEAFYSSNALSKLYEQPILTNLFYIASDPVDISDVSLNGLIFKALDLIPVVSQNQIPQGYIPADINLKISYFQVTKYRKKIIKCDMKFNSLIDSTTISSQSNFTYQLSFSFHSMGHAELAIAFALDWPIYLLLSCIIGIFSIAMICIYFIFYRISNILTRRVIATQSQYNFLSIKGIKEIFQEIFYFLTLYPPIIKGIAIAAIPNALLLFIMSVVMLGSFWGISILGCDQLTDDYICENSLFEIILQDKISQQVRRGRLGISLIITGFYICIRMSVVFVPPSKEDKIQESIDNFKSKYPSFKFNILSTLNFLSDKSNFLHTESYDGNIWRDKTWTRGIYIFITILILIIMIIIIYLSFSVYYGVNIWMFMFLLKINQIIIEESLKIYIENELLLGSLSCVMTMTNSVSGLGATDFFDYLFNTFVGLGIQCFEKVSQVLIVEEISENAIIFIDKLKKWVVKQFSTSETEEIEEINNQEDVLERNENQDKDQSQNQNQENKNGSDKDNSQIVLTEFYEESFATIEDGGNHFLKNQKSIHLLNSKDTDTAEANNKKVKDKSHTDLNVKTQQKINDVRQTIQTLQHIQQISQNSVEEVKLKSKVLTTEEDLFENVFQNAFDKKFMKNIKKKEKQEEEIVVEKNIEEYETNRQIKIFIDFCYNSLNILGTPIQVIALWMFYDANQVFVKWGITKAGLVFYFLFNVSSIPFQMFVDIFFIKSVEQLHQVCIKDYVRSVRERFKNRKCNWKIDDTSDVLTCLEPDLKYIDGWCFSSQLFFCFSIFIGGSICIIEGVITIITNNYNFLNDQQLFLIIILWLPFCYFMEQSCYFLYNHTSLWKLQQNAQSQKVTTNEQEILMQQFQQQPLSQQFVQSKITTPQMTLRRQDKLEQDFSPLQLPAEPYSPFRMQLNTDQLRSKFQQLVSLSNNANYMNLLSSRDNLYGVKSEEGIINQHQQGQYASKQSIFANQFTINQQITKKFTTQKYSLAASLYKNPSIQRFHRSSTETSQNAEREIDYEDFFQEVAKLIQENPYIKMFLENEVKNAFDQDLTVQNFILHNLQSERVFKQVYHSLILKQQSFFFFSQKSLPLLDKTEQVIGKMKYSNDYKIKKKQWESYKINFKKAQKFKELHQKLEERKLHLLQNEYKDEKFLKKFLKTNKVWMRKNIKSMFEDLMKGGSGDQLQQQIKIQFQQKLINQILSKMYRLKSSILSEFNQIYGDLKLGDNVQQIQVQTVKPIYLTKQEAQKVTGTYIQGLLKYWRQRNHILSIAEKCVSGFLLKGAKQSCDYCKGTWGLQLQTQESIEDLFNLYYKYECNKLNFYFNVIILFERDILIIDQRKYRRDRDKFESQYEQVLKNVKPIESIFNEEQDNNSDDNFFSENSRDNSFTDSHPDDSNDDFSRSSDIHQFQFNQSSSQQDQNYDNRQRKRNSTTNKMTQFFIQYNNLKKDKESRLMNKQKFIERWQEFYFQNATFTTICFYCNDKAQQQYMERIQEQRRKREQEQFLLQQQQQKQQQLQNNLLANLFIQQSNNENQEQEKLEEFGNIPTLQNKKRKDTKKSKIMIEEEGDERQVNEIVNEVKEDEEEDNDFFANEIRPKSQSTKIHKVPIFNKREVSLTRFENQKIGSSKNIIKSFRNIFKKQIDNQSKSSKSEIDKISINQDIQNTKEEFNKRKDDIHQDEEEDDADSKIKNLRFTQQDSFNHVSDSSDSSDSQVEQEENKEQLRYKNNIKSIKSFKSQESKTYPLNSQNTIKTQNYIEDQAQNSQNNYLQNTVVQPEYKKQFSKKLKEKGISEYMNTINYDYDQNQLVTLIESPQNLISFDQELINSKKFSFSYSKKNNTTLQQNLDTQQMDQFFIQSPKHIDIESDIYTQQNYTEEVFSNTCLKTSKYQNHKNTSE